MNTNANALTVVDGFDDAGDNTASPVRGRLFNFKEGSFNAGSELFTTYGEEFTAYDTAIGWQKLTKGAPPEYLMRLPGQPLPPQPHVDAKDWPKNFNGVHEHPFRLTRFMYFINNKTGEVSTFSASTVGGKIAFDQLAQQGRSARSAHPDAVPVVALESALMPTQYGSKKPRPHFRIIGYRLRSQIGSQNLLTDIGGQKLLTDEPSIKSPPIAEEMNDELPSFEEPPKKVAKARRVS